MAHVIIFLDAKTQQPIDDFFGYAQGIFYRAFDAAHCDAGCSGSGETVRRSAAQIRDGVQTILESGIVAVYPDPERLTTICERLLDFIASHPDANIDIGFF